MTTDVREQAIVDALHHVPTERWDEVLRFLNALREDAPSIRTAADLARSGLVGLWGDRNDIEDHSEFARRLREVAERRPRDADVVGF